MVLFCGQPNPDLDVMNNESPETSAQQQSEPVSDAKPVQPSTPTAPSQQPNPVQPSEADPVAEEHAGARGEAAPETAQPPGPVSNQSGDESAQTPPQGADKPAQPAASPLRPKIQVGSRRKRSAETASQTETTSKTDPTAEKEHAADKQHADRDIPPSPAGPIPRPSARDPLPPELEQELGAALDDASLDEMLTGAATEAAATPIELESRRQTTVTRINGDNVFCSLGGRHEGVTSLRQFAEPPALGSHLEVIVKSYSADDGLYELRIPGTAVDVDDWSDLVEGMIVEARITGANTGGLECKVGGLRGFVPASQIALFRVEDYADYVDQKLPCVVTEVNPKRKNLVLSRRAVLEREKEEARQKLLDSLEVGQVVEGVVRKIMPFGAFVDIGGIDGLVHISQLSWDRVEHPSEVLQETQQIRVKIEKIDTQTGKIGLSYRDLLEHPWHKVEEKFPVNTVVKGTVSRTAKFGAFVKLAPGVEGLIHISELSHGRVPNVGAVVSEGQEVEVKVLSIDTEAQRMALSIKAALPEPEGKSDESPDGGEEAVKTHREELAAKRTKPLKGGIGRDSGGAQFGLKW